MLTTPCFWWCLRCIYQSDSPCIPPHWKLYRCAAWRNDKTLNERRQDVCNTFRDDRVYPGLVFKGKLFFTLVDVLTVSYLGNWFCVSKFMERFKFQRLELISNLIFRMKLNTTKNIQCPRKKILCENSHNPKLNLKLLPVKMGTSTLHTRIVQRPLSTSEKCLNTATWSVSFEFV